MKSYFFITKTKTCYESDYLKSGYKNNIYMDVLIQLMVWRVYIYINSFHLSGTERV